MEKLNFDPFPTLVTERLVLRKIQNNDETEIFRLRSDDRIMKFLDRPKAKSIDDARILVNKINDDLENNIAITWAITLKSDPALIGTIGFWKILKEHFRGQIGYLLNFDFQGKGIMQEALSKVVGYGFKIMELHSIEAHVNPGNSSSIKLLERIDFIREGYFKENFYYNGRFLDTAIYARLNPQG